MPIAIKSHVNTAILSGDTIFVHASPEAVSKGLCVVQNGQRSGLMPVSNPSESLPTPPFQASFLPDEGDVPLELHTPNGARMGPAITAPVNQLRDWALEGGRTVQVQIKNAANAHILSLGATVTAPTGLHALRFKAFLAAHRCEARLLVHAAPLNGAAPIQAEMAFDANHMGGLSANGYLDAEIPLTVDPASAARVSLHLVYEACTVALDNHHPYLFLANPRLEDTPRWPVGDTEAVWIPVGFAAAANWYTARLATPFAQDGAPVVLDLQNDTCPLVPPTS